MATSTPADHGRHETFDDVDRAHEVDFDDLAPVAMLQVLDDAPYRDPRDLHHHVHAAAGVVDVARERANGVEVRNVERAHVRDLAARAPDLAHDVLELPR